MYLAEFNVCIKEKLGILWQKASTILTKNRRLWLGKLNVAIMNVKK